MPVSRLDRDAGFTLVELAVVAAIFLVVLLIITSFLVSANNAVAVSTARIADESAARAALAQMETNIRFAAALSTSSDGNALYVGSLPPCTTTTWRYTPGAPGKSGQLTEQLGSGHTSVVALGVYAPASPGLVFGSAGATGAYKGLVTISFAVNLPGNERRDKGGAAVVDTLSASNMSVPVPNDSSAVC